MKFLIPLSRNDKKPFKPGQLITVKHIVYRYVKCHHHGDCLTCDISHAAYRKSINPEQFLNVCKRCKTWYHNFKQISK